MVVGKYEHLTLMTIKLLRVNSPTSKPKLPKSSMKKNSDHHGSGPWWLLPWFEWLWP
uniref:Uncharacterized protein n=1 Tax=Fagus sylvatica TaxID=28930 RepID=A0A2N9F3A4_FAGSY